MQLKSNKLKKLTKKEIERELEKLRQENKELKRILRLLNSYIGTPELSCPNCSKEFFKKEETQNGCTAGTYISCFRDVAITPKKET
jgi:hypothetical protein